MYFKGGKSDFILNVYAWLKKKMQWECLKATQYVLEIVLKSAITSPMSLVKSSLMTAIKSPQSCSDWKCYFTSRFLFTDETIWV